MSNFIYVFSDEGRDVLLSRQYKLLRSDAKTHTYIFANEDRQDFSCDEVPYAMSDTLIF